MKKVIGLIVMFMVLVIMVLTTNVSMADEITYGITDWEAEELIEKWAEAQGLDDWTIHNDVNGVIYYAGGLNIDDFEKYEGIEWSMENWVEWSMNEYHMTKIEVKKVGEIEGSDIYRVNAESDDTVIVHMNEKDYYKADVIFLVYSKKSM